MKATLGGKAVPFTVPTSWTVCYEVSSAAAISPLRAFGAALGLAWAGLHKPKAKYRGNVLAYGAEVLDELRARGISAAELHAAGAEVWRAMNESLPEEPEVEEAAGNSEPPKGAEPPGTEK